MAKYVIDVQGYSVEKSFLIKELSIVNLDSENVLHFLVKPPFNRKLLSYDDQRCVSRLQYNYHKISWDDGVFDYSEVLMNLLRATQNARVIYVKGMEKAAIIRKLTGKFTIDLDELHCPRAIYLPTPRLVNVLTCSYYSHSSSDANCKCSLLQALKYKEWIIALFERGVDEVC